MNYAMFEERILKTFSANNLFSKREILNLYSQFINQKYTWKDFVKHLTKYYARKKKIR